MTILNQVRRRLAAAVVAGAATLACAPAHATVPVIDVASIVQLIQQLEAWRSQLDGMEQQIGQLRQTYGAMTGGRGMQALLATTLGARNYLPPDWSDVLGAAGAAAGTYGVLHASIRSTQASNAVLSAADLSRFSSALRAMMTADRQGVAGSEVVMKTAYANSSQRFAALQVLINQIGATPDAKAIAELQARIAAEQVMVANDGLKLAAAAQIASADAAARELARREQVVANHGAFASRLQPVPPAP
jgi:type IV secretion system protein VirB5